MIPARYAATSFPGKLMQLLANKTVICHTHDATIATGLFDEVIVVTDSILFIMKLLHGGKAMMSKKEHESGTDRIAEAAAEMNRGYYCKCARRCTLCKKRASGKVIATIR